MCPTEKIFRQNAYLVISLVKLLLSRNFCQKCVRVNSRNFHTVCTIHDCTFAILREIKVVVNCKKLNFPNATYLSTLLIAQNMFEMIHLNFSELPFQGKFV